MFSWVREKWNGSSSALTTGQCKVYVASDIHIHHRSNLDHIQGWPRAEGEPSILIIAGDIATKLDEIRNTLLHLLTLYDHVIYVPGNNEVLLSIRTG